MGGDEGMAELGGHVLPLTVGKEFCHLEPRRRPHSRVLTCGSFRQQDNN